MAINFPDSPSNGDTFTANGKTFVYNSTNTSWRPQTAAESGGTDVLADMAALIAKTGMSNGDQALVQSNNNLYMYSGSGWYKIATIQNDAPSAITGVDGSYALATDGTTTTITAVSTDPEGFALTWSYTASGLGSIATVSQVDNVFTVTPSTDAANAGSFTLTISATDGINGAVSTVPSFTLAFTVTNSRYTSLSLKATATGSNQTFDDASASNHTITVAGNSTTSTLSPYRHGGYSLRFENSVADDNNIKFNNVSGSGAVAASGEFCVETWVKFTVTPPPAGSANARIFASNGTGGNQTNNIQMYIEYGGSYIGAVSVLGTSAVYLYTASSTSEVINDGLWHHLAVTRDSSNNLRWFIDGTLITTIASNTTTFQFEETRLGKRDGGTGATCYTGDMRDTRVVIGSSVYESAFTPPTEPLTAITNTYLLVGDLPYIKDESTNNFSIHAGTFNNGSNVRTPKKSPISVFDNVPYSKSSHGMSAYFDGTDDNISVANHADFNVGSSDFTLECWAYIESVGGGICGVYHSSTNQRSYRIGVGSSEHFSAPMSSDGTYQSGSSIDSGVDVSNYLNQWVHLALTKSGTNATLYLNGNSIGTTSSAPSTLHATTDAFTVGGAGSVKNTGYISDVRLVKGSVVYSSNFTPPNVPLTAITNTKFLLNPETSISDLSQSSEITCVGDAATSTTQVKFAGTKSIYTGGNSTSLIKLDANDDLYNLSYGEGDFTVEGWFYTTDNTNNPKLYIDITSSGDYWQLYYISGSGITLRSNVNMVSQIYSTETGDSFTENTWHHIAVCRSGSNYKVFHNGTGIIDVTTTNQIGSHSSKTIGGTDYSAGNNLRGYIQDFRITKGLARYTANFTPPTAELQG